MGLEMWPKYGNRNYSGTNTVPPVPFPLTRQYGEIDLRSEMKIMLEGNQYYPRRGHWVILRRMDKRQRCFCWNSRPITPDEYNEDKGKYNEPELRCPVCNGEGWVYDDELHLARRRIVAPEIGLAGIEVNADIGLMNVTHIVYYLQYYVNPKKEDKILEVELGADEKPVHPYNILEMHKIAIAEPFRDQNGRIEFWRAAAKLEVT